MTYRAFQPERRQRRRRWPMIVLTLLLVVVAIAFLVSRETEQRGTVEFFAAADEASLIHAEAATKLGSTLAQLGPALSRQEVTRRLEEATISAAEADALLDIDAPPSVGNLYGHLTVASHSWAQGSSEVERVVLGMMDGDIVQGGEQQLEAALDLLRVGDTAYALFLEGVDGFDGDVVVPSFERIAYIDTETFDPLAFDAQSLALRIGAAYNLAPQHDLSVSGSTDPTPVGDREGVPLVPFSDSLVLNIIVSNAGNEDESAIPVEVSVLDVDTGSVTTDRATIDQLAAGASTTVTFAELPFAPGGLFQVTASATIPNDMNPENDMWTLTFIWNDES